MKPTLASLKVELSAMTKQAELYEQSLQEHAQVREENEEQLDTIRSPLLPLLAYFGQQWIGDAVRADYQALVTFCERTGR